MVDAALSMAVVSRCDDSSQGRDPNGVVAARCQRDHALPFADRARACRQIASGDDASIVLEADGVEVARRDVGEVAPVSNGTLPSSVVPGGQRCPVRPPPNRVPITAGDGLDLAPRLHFALSFRVATRCHHGAICKEPEGSSPPRTYGDDFSPILQIALTVAVPPRGQNCAIRSEADSMRFSGVDRCVYVARRYGNDAGPLPNPALLGPAVTHGNDRSVPTTSDRVASPRRYCPSADSHSPPHEQG